MDKIISELFERLPNWFFILSSILLLILLISISIPIWIAVKRYADSAGKENRIITLQEDIATHKKISEVNINSTSQLQNVLMNTRSFFNAFNQLKYKDEIFYDQLIQRIVEAIAADIKSQGGERHRCGIWIEVPEQGQLKLTTGSSGFPEQYIGNRVLDINNSIAGRSFRKKQIIKVDNVVEDTDWSSQDSTNSYSALICIPLGNWGVVTIDAKNPLNENAQLIGELYCSIIEGIMEELLNIMAYNEHEQDVEVQAGS
ncbi:hypothetical protein [Bacillus sp. 03113]|uniref:GAF domain-containing protein n=1 Tax=Bacillus sp. 03113 TaxID=2578211 RepID=UPI0011439BA5|nr:hypothetical protein [Bacillus sp. 03113]